MHRYPFGRPVTARPPSADDARAVFIVGAYPSALHVEWTPPAPFGRVRALPVDDEPTPFWTGDDQDAHVRSWLERIGFDSRWGVVRANHQYNGPCGQTLRTRFLEPLRLVPSDVWITDCLDTYRMSVGVMNRIADTFDPWAASMGLSPSRLESHPDEAEIVREALAHHRERLIRELTVARCETLITLGNAALRVMRELMGCDGPRKLTVEDYATERTIRFMGRTIRWLALAHPAAPQIYQTAHCAWLRTLSDGGVPDTPLE